MKLRIESRLLSLSPIHWSQQQTVKSCRRKDAYGQKKKRWRGEKREEAAVYEIEKIGIRL